MSLFSCHENLEDRAEREAREYTEKNCPTPVVNDTRTDSIVFYKATKTYHYYCTFMNKIDNVEIIKKNRSMIRQQISKSIANDTNIKVYKDAGFKFAYTCRSASNPDKILYNDVFTKEDYNNLK